MVRIGTIKRRLVGDPYRRSTGRQGEGAYNVWPTVNPPETPK